MARPRRTEAPVVQEEQTTEAPVVQEEQTGLEVIGVSFKTSLFSFGFNGVEYIAKNGIITIPSEAIEAFKSHG